MISKRLHHENYATEVLALDTRTPTSQVLFCSPKSFFFGGGAEGALPLSSPSKVSKVTSLVSRDSNRQFVQYIVQIKNDVQYWPSLFVFKWRYSRE